MPDDSKDGDIQPHKTQRLPVELWVQIFKELDLKDDCDRADLVSFARTSHFFREICHEILWIDIQNVSGRKVFDGVPLDAYKRLNLQDPLVFVRHANVKDVPNSRAQSFLSRMPNLTSLHMLV
jgi:hypothetical protein